MSPLALESNESGRRVISRIRKASQIQQHIQEILERVTLGRYVKVQKKRIEEHRFRQHHRGRPGPQTTYRRITRKRWDLVWTTDQALIASNEKSDGMYPLLTNDRKLVSAQVLEAHKGQPTLEKRFEQCKTVQALIERQLRMAMKKEGIHELPLYPEERLCKHPSTEQILRLFGHTQRHVLLQKGRVLQIFEPELTELQREVLRLLEVRKNAYWSSVLGPANDSKIGLRK